MKRETWTDERMDDFARRVYQHFEQVDGRFQRVELDIRDLRTEMRAEFANVRREMKDGFDEVRGLTLRMGSGIVGAIVISVLVRGI
ncbi:MAG: hypothetical protein JST31_15430 [Actinobacteria bacterium]|nr:hypothetical protein [Actinomycetota bacterium]